MMKKFTSRKFIAMIASTLIGIALIISGNAEEGTVAVVASVLTYICAEAHIDKAAVKNVLNNVADNIDNEQSEE